MVNALFVWGLARAHGGRVLLRIEDHDRGRCRAEYERGLLEDLEWLGLVPDGGGSGERFRQRERGAVYDAALARIAAVEMSMVYTCVCSRRDIDAIAGDAGGVETRYPGTCRGRAIDPSLTPARRVRMDPGSEPFDDIVHGPMEQTPAEQCGDVLVRDRAGNWTYQFAVVLDDIAQGVDVVIRGDDLLESTGRQIRLARLLGRADPPVFLHHPLIRKQNGAKLSKSDGDTGIRELRAAGWSPERVIGHAAALAGLADNASARTLDGIAETF